MGCNRLSEALPITETVRDKETAENGRVGWPELPTSFRAAETVARLTERHVPEVAPAKDQEESSIQYRGPCRVLRTAIASMANFDT